MGMTKLCKLVTKIIMNLCYDNDDEDGPSGAVTNIPTRGPAIIVHVEAEFLAVVFKSMNLSNLYNSKLSISRVYMCSACRDYLPWL